MGTCTNHTSTPLCTHFSIVHLKRGARRWRNVPMETFWIDIHFPTMFQYIFGSIGSSTVHEIVSIVSALVELIAAGATLVLASIGYLYKRHTEERDELNRH